MFPAEHPTSVGHLGLSTLHITASRLMYALLESYCSHGSSFIGVVHDLSVLVPNAEDEAWSQHKHLHDLGNLKNTGINLNSHRI